MKPHDETNDRFDPVQFQRILSRYILILMIPLFVGMIVLDRFTISNFNTQTSGSGDGSLIDGKRLNEPTSVIGPFHVGGISTAPFAFGGLAIGAVAMGGAAIGVIAVGGGAVGIIALGGGAVGFIAVGGGAVGLIAIGGGASGVYVLGGSGQGRYVLSRERQDIDAIHFFCRWLPGLRSAFGKSIDI